MSESLTGSLPESLKTIQTRHLITLRLKVKPIISVGQTPNGFRRVGVIFGGAFDGERLSGTVLDGANDWQLVRPDGSVSLDVRITLQTQDDHFINMYYTGIRAGNPDILKRIDAGETVDPTAYYFRTTPRFETASEKYAWLNNILCIGTGHRDAAGPIYSIFEVR